MATFGTTIGSGGFRFYDKNHEISHNYVEGVYGGNFQGPMLLDSGDAEGSSSNLSGHWRVVNAKVLNNVIVDCPEGVRIGDNYDLAPTGCTIDGNLVARAANGKAIEQLIAPVSTTIGTNPYFATPEAGGLVRDSAQIWRKEGVGPRLTFLQAADVGVTGDPDDTDGTGALVSDVPGGGDDEEEPPPTTDQDTAAGRYGWGLPLPVSDEFDYEGVPDPNKWKLPGADWEGHNGNGTRDPERVVVQDGRLIMSGLANGSTGWMQHKFDQQYGRWEVRCRSRALEASNGNDYHPVLLIWPTSNSRQQDGEYDFLENGAPGEQDAGAFLHYPHPGTEVVQQEHFEKEDVDLTQWHNFALEWTPDHLKLFCDGELWGEASGGANSVRRDIQDMPSGHGTIQLDNFDGTDQTPAVFEVEWYRVYTLTPVVPPPTGKTVTPSGIPSAETFGFPLIDGGDTAPPPNSHPTLLGTDDTILGRTVLGYTLGEGDPDPAGPKTVSDAGNIATAQGFGLPLVTVADGPQLVRALSIDPPTAFGSPTVAAEPAPPAAPGGVLVPSVYAVDRDGSLIPLPAWTSLKPSPQRNSQGSISIDYPAGAPGFEVLDEGVSAHPLRALEIRIWLGGSQEGALGGWLTNKSGDDLEPGSGWTFTGHFHEWLLSKALIAPQERNEANPKGELRFSAATAGLVLTTIMDQAQARGALPLVTRDFTATHDSNGQPWPETVSSLVFAPKTTVQQAADKLVELGMLEYELTAARVWRAYAAGTQGVDRTTGLTPLTFAHAINLSEHSRRESARDAGTAVLAAGNEGFYAWAESATAVAELGWRAEVAADAGQLESETAVQAAAATYLEAISQGVAEFVCSVEFATGVPLPIVDWNIGDWAYTWVGTRRRRLRIAQIEIEFNQGEPPRGTVALNDLITDKVAALYKRLNAITSGDAVVGTSEPSTGGSGEDRIPPAAPTGLTVSSTIAYRDPGQIPSLALVSAGWAPVITDAYFDAETSFKAEAAELIADRMATAIAVGRTADDSTAAGRVNAANLIAQRLSSALNDQDDDEDDDSSTDTQIFEDWTWEDMPEIVEQHHSALLDEFRAAGFSGDNITLSEQALQWLRDYEGPTSNLYENWTWDGAPQVVIIYAPILKEEFGQSHPDQNLPDFPEQVAVIAQAWLAEYAATHQGSGAVTGDVDHYRVNYAYLGSQPLTESEQQQVDQGLLGGITWIEPDGSPTRATSLTFGNIEGGRSLGVRVRAVDRSGNEGPWSEVVAVDTARDDLPPPRPSKPITWTLFKTLNITWDGKGDSGEDMLVAAPDILSGGGIEVHVGEGIDFPPHRPTRPDGTVDLAQSTTFRTMLYAAGTTNVTDLAIGKTYYARFVAVDRAGNASVPSQSSLGVQPQQLVNIDIGPGAIARQQIIDGEIVRAKIADLAVNSAKVEEIEVGKLTAGTMNAQVVVGGSFSTPSINGNQLQFDSAGIRLIRGNTVVGRWQVADASMLVTGTYLSGLTGERIEIHPNGTMRIYGATGVEYGELANVGGIWRATSRPDPNGRRSAVDFDPTGFRATYGTSTVVRSRFDVGLTYSVMNAPVTGIRVLSHLTPDDGSASRFHFVFANASGDINDTVLHYVLNSFKGDDPTFLAPGLSPEGAGITFSNNNVQFVRGDGNAWVDISIAELNTPSTELVKRDITPIRHDRGRTSLDVVMSARAYSYVYDWDVDPIGPRSVRVQRRGPDGEPCMQDEPVDVTRRRAPRRHYGPIAEHLAAVAPDLVHENNTGDLMVSETNKLGLLWDAVQVLGEKVRRLEGDTGPIIVEGSVQDPSRWAELPNGEDPSA